MTYQEFEQTAKEYVANDKLAEAISLMSAYFKDEPDIDAIILQSGRYHSLKRDQQNGTIDYNTLQTAFNQLRANILSFLERHQPISSETTASTSENTSMEEKINLSHARISILRLLQDNQENENGMTISQIQQSTNTHKQIMVW